MSELKPLPCPFCGGAPRTVARPDNIDGTQFFYALACYCGGYSACAHKMALEPTPEQAKSAAIEAWNRRAQPAQAVPASCGECGKKASDGWALYCVACMEKAGLPAVTDSPPLMHSCTSSLGKTPDSTAQAGQVLSDAEIDDAYEKARADYQRSRFAVRGQQLTAQDSPDWWFARAIEQAVRAKLGVAVPMPPEDWSVFNTGAEVASGLTWAEAWDYMTPSRIERGWTAVCVANKSNIGIVGKEGA